MHESDDPERTLVTERRGAIVVLAGRNRPKLGTIARLHAAGFHVLADKPWLTDRAALPDLERASAGWPLAMDIMTFRHEVVAGLTGRVAALPELFGDFDTSADEPAIDVRSVHHLLKVVNGAPLRRPAWYYDTRVQGDGLVDIQSHMTDQTQWLAGDGTELDYRRDFELTGAERWATPVPLDLFRTSTGLEDFPEPLRERVEAGVLALACNGEIRYRLRGIPVRQRAEWGQREPDGGGDAHGATVRGTDATIVARRGPETGFRAELHVAPREPGPRFDARLDEALSAWGRDLPGLARRPSPVGQEIVIPDVHHTPTKRTSRSFSTGSSTTWRARSGPPPSPPASAPGTPSSRGRTNTRRTRTALPRAPAPDRRRTGGVRSPPPSTNPSPAPRIPPARRPRGPGTRRVHDREEEPRRCRRRDTAIFTGTR